MPDNTNQTPAPVFCPPVSNAVLDVGTIAYGALALASSGVCAYHGAKRNNGSIGWAFAWGCLGSLFPVLAPAVAFAQGIGKPADQDAFAARNRVEAEIDREMLRNR